MDNNSPVVLVVEDDVGIQFLIWQLLKADGLNILRASSGEAALQTSRSYPGAIDLLLADMELPGMSGLEVCRILVAERPGLKALTMSGGAQGRELASANGFPFLPKPFSPAALRDSIQWLLHSRRNSEMKAAGQG